MSRLERAAWGAGFRIFAALVVLAAAWWILAWPWMVATSNAVKQGHPKGSTEYNSAGWTAELIYLAAVAVLVFVGILFARNAKGKRHRTPGWRQATGDPPGLRRWWDGTFFTDRTQWDFHAVRPIGATFTHGSCSVRHRTYGAAARCKGTV